MILNIIIKESNKEPFVHFIDYDIIDNARDYIDNIDDLYLTIFLTCCNEFNISPKDMHILNERYIKNILIKLF